MNFGKSGQSERRRLRVRSLRHGSRPTEISAVSCTPESVWPPASVQYSGSCIASWEQDRPIEVMFMLNRSIIAIYWND
jgi:hypothetical protein